MKWADVRDVVTAEMAKIKKANPTLKQAEVMKRAWATKVVKDKHKEYNEFKAKQAKK